MFCSECGAKVAGKFCAECGHQLQPADDGVDPTVILSLDWTNLIDYEQVTAIPAVRDRVARAAAQSEKRLTGEDFLDLYGKALGNLAGVPLPMTTVAHFAQKTYAKLGVKTGKSRAQVLATPPGETLVTLLCSLARNGQAVRSVHQMSDGCIIRATLPSDLFALEGELVIALSRRGRGTLVDAHTDIPGQLFDWGKSTRRLEQLFGELATSAAA